MWNSKMRLVNATLANVASTEEQGLTLDEVRRLWPKSKRGLLLRTTLPSTGWCLAGHRARVNRSGWLGPLELCQREEPVWFRWRRLAVAWAPGRRASTCTCRRDVWEDFDHQPAGLDGLGGSRYGFERGSARAHPFRQFLPWDPPGADRADGRWQFLWGRRLRRRPGPVPEICFWDSRRSWPTGPSSGWEAGGQERLGIRRDEARGRISGTLVILTPSPPSSASTARPFTIVARFADEMPPSRRPGALGRAG
jgi:hypothetical protein